MKKQSKETVTTMHVRFPIIFTLIFIVAVSVCYINQKIHYRDLLISLKEKTQSRNELVETYRTLSSEASVLYSSKRIIELAKQTMSLQKVSEDNVVYLKVESSRSLDKLEKDDTIDSKRGFFALMKETLLDMEIARAHER